jgi:ubiquitin-like-conjugating enzyme ATG10
MNLDKVYGLLAPVSLRPQMQSIGVMGALGMTDHPVTGTAAYFVHPCRTAEALEAVTGHECVSPQRYLLLWIGLVGQSVGLDIPTELAEATIAAI